MIKVQCILLALLTVVGGYCVYVHDADNASDRAAEHPFLALGHFEAVLIEDGIVVLLLLGAAAVSYLVSDQTKVCRLQTVAFLGVTAILLIEFFSEVAVLCTENPRLLSVAGQITRVFEVLLSGGVALWSAVLATYIHMTRAE